jgi:hypothetical protein
MTVLAHLPNAVLASEERKQRTAAAIHSAVVQGGRIESQSDYHAVIVNGPPVNHVLHLLLTLVTFGVWLIVWLALIAFGGEKRKAVSVDEYGNVLNERL